MLTETYNYQVTEEEQVLVCLFFGLLWQIEQRLQNEDSKK